MAEIPSDTIMDSDDGAFKAWMRQVDAVVAATAGVSVYDLPDFAFRDAFDDGLSPKEVAKSALAEAGF